MGCAYAPRTDLLSFLNAAARTSMGRVCQVYRFDLESFRYATPYRIPCFIIPAAKIISLFEI